MAGLDAFGTVLEIHDGASTYDAVAEIVSIDILDAQVDDIDVSSHDSTGQWREFIGGMKDGGELGFELNFDPSVHQELLDILGVTRSMRITMPAGIDDVYTFSGYIKSLSAAAPHDDKLSASAAIKVTGPITHALT